MKRSITFAALASVAALALSACGAGLTSQTADQQSTVPGVSAQAPGQGGKGTISVRNAMLTYPGTEGYKAGSQAQVKIWLFNDSPETVQVVIKPGPDAPITSAAGADTPITIPPGGYAKPDVKFTVDQPIRNDANVPVQVNFVSVRVFDLKLSIEPPNAPAEPHKIEIETPAGEGH